jgi:hypothetical protein
VHGVFAGGPGREPPVGSRSGSAWPRGRWQALGGQDRLGRGGLSRGDGLLQRRAAGTGQQADEPRAGEGEEEVHDGHVSTCCVKARAAAGTVRHEQEGGPRIPARLEQGLCYLQMPLFARDIEVEASVPWSLEEKRLTSCLDQSF